MNILVTGSNGQLGRCIQDLSNFSSDLTFYFTDVVELDITNEAYVNKYFSEISLDYCINCAAYTNVDKAESDKALAYKINAEAVRNLANACSKNDVTLIHISTDFVFDGRKTEPYTEQDKPNPINIYGKSKLKGELYVQEILSKYFVVRTSWVYSEYGHNFVKTMLGLGKQRKELTVVGDQYGSPTYAMNLAEFILERIEKKSKAYGLYHYSNIGGISWFDFAKKIFKFSEIKKNILAVPSTDYQSIALRPQNSVLDTDHVRKIFKISIPDWETSLETCLKKMKF